MSALPPVIAVDGPSGVGKGMVTRWLAHELGWHRLDSGALYRILALAAQRAGISHERPEAVAALAPGLDIRFVGTTEADEAILVDGEDWTSEIRAESTGGRMQGGTVDSRGDHRIAMSFAVAGLRAEQPIRILDCANVNTSFPGFADLAASAGLNIVVQG